MRYHKEEEDDNDVYGEVEEKEEDVDQNWPGASTSNCQLDLLPHGLIGFAGSKGLTLLMGIQDLKKFKT